MFSRTPKARHARFTHWSRVELKTFKRWAKNQPDQPSAPFPKFVIRRSTLCHELRKQRGTSKSMILVPLFDLKFLIEFAATGCRNFKSAALELRGFVHARLRDPQRARAGNGQRRRRRYWFRQGQN